MLIHRRWLTLLLLATPIVVIFAPVLFTNRTFAFRDGAHFYHPLFQWIAREWGEGRVPLWNPQENCGLPVLADATSSIFYPGKLLFLLPLPFAWLYNVYIVAHVLLAAVSMYALARRLKASEPAAVIAAIAYACGGNVVFQYCNVIFLVGAAWLPAALLAIEVIVATRCWRAMIGFAIVLALMILGGDPQMAYHALLAAGFRLLCAWLAGVPRAEPRAPAIEAVPGVAESGRWWHPIPLLAGSAILAFLLAAVQVLPSSEATKTSERAAYHRPRNIYEAAAVLSRDHASDSLLAETPSEAIVAGIIGQPEPTLHQDRAYNYSVSPWRVIEFIWPNIAGKPFPTNRRWMQWIPGDAQPWTPTMYFGLLPLLAGVVALRFWRTTPTTRWLSSLVIFFALGSLGWYGFGWLLREVYGSILKGDPKQLSIGAPFGGVYWLLVTFLPSYIYFRYPAKLMVVAVAALCVLAATQLDRIWAKRAMRWEAVLHWLAYGSAALAFGVWIALSIGWRITAPNHPTFGPADLAGMRWDVLGGLLQTAVVAWLLAWLLKKHWQSEEEKAAAGERWKWSIATLTAFELVVANSWLIITAPSPMWSESSPLVTVMQPTSELPLRFFRGSYHGWHPASFRQDASHERLQELARWEHDSLFPKFQLVGREQLVESYGSLKSLDYESLLLIAREISNSDAGGTRVPTPSVLRMLGTEYLVLPASANLPFADRLSPPEGASWPENVSLWRLKRPLPRAWVVPHVVQLSPLTQPLDIPAVDDRSREVLIGERDGKRLVRDFRDVAVVETSARLIPDLLKTDAKFDIPPRCEVVLATPQHVRIRTRLEQPGLLILSDTFAPGWEAWAQAAQWFDAKTPNVERQELVIHRTNRCFRGVELSPGEWIVDFEYRPRSFMLGAMLSVTTCLGLCICALAPVFRRRVLR